MAEIIQKSLTLTKQKVVEVEGEHRVTFIASTANEDRDYEHVNISTFRLPLKGGGHIIVSDLPTEGATDVDVPLLTDHDLFSVDKVIGSVRRAFWDGVNLIFEAGISSRAYAQDVFKLLQEGHLDNAFSIQYRDYTHDSVTNTDSNGEIIEVSLVTRGSNMDARVLATKAVKGKEVEGNETTAPVEAPVEITEVETKEVETTEETVAEEEVKVEEPAKEETPEAEPETETEPEAKEEPEVKTEELQTNKEDEMNPEVAKSLVKEAEQTVTAVKSVDYLKTKSAVKDFAKCIAENGKFAAKAWTEQLSAKGITGDAILPAEIEQIFFKAWIDNPGVLATFRNVRLTAGAINAFNTTSRALGHKKGEAKANQDLENIRRDLKAKIIYKKLPIDLQDLIDDQTGELLRFRVEELADRVANEIVVSAILGDGRSEDTPDYRTFDGTRGLFSMVADITNSATPATYKFAAAVASIVANDATDTAYDKAVKTLAAIKGDRKVLVVPEGWKAGVLLTKNTAGQYIFVPGTNLEAILDCRIIELPEMTGAAYDVIAYVEGAYVLMGTGNMVRTDFDLTYNQDVMLVERAVAGSLAGNKVAAGYAAAVSA